MSAVDEETARAAVRIIFSFLYQQGDSAKVAALAAKIPGAAEYIDSGDEDSAATLGGLGGLMGGGAMEVLGKLQALGLGMGQIQGVTKETVDFAREKAGERGRQRHRRLDSGAQPVRLSAKLRGIFATLLAAANRALAARKRLS